MSFATIDFFFFACILVCVIICTIKGFVDSFFDKAAPVVAIIAAVCFYKNFMGLMTKFISNQLLCSVATFLAVFVIVFVVIKILQNTIGKIFEEKILSSLNHTLGFIFGIAEAFAIIFFLLFLLSAQPFFDASKLLDGSFFYSIFHKILGDSFIPSWNSGFKGSVAAFLNFFSGGQKIV